MRYVYLVFILAVTALVAIFALQNLEPVTISFASASVTLPASLLVLSGYVLGMFTGGALLAVLKSWKRKAFPKPT